MEPVLVVDGLRVRFGDAEPVVDGVSFELTPGRVLAVVGESGSGKSVSAMSLLGLLPPTAEVSGSATFDGAQLIGASEQALREVRGAGVGVVFQEPMASFTPVLRLGTQIAEAVTAHRPHLAKAEVRTRVHELLVAAGIDEPERVARSYPHELSGGQLQRAMIAQALAGDPKALIADEPTTALDVTVQAGILDLLRTLCRERSLAVLLITHDMGVVADVADDVLVMRRGVPVEQRPVAELFADPSADYTRELLAAVPELEAAEPDTAIRGDASRGVDAEAGEIVAELRDVAVRYARSGEPTVSGIDLTLRAGQTVGLVGESGSGKSTIGRALAGLVPVVAGSVTVAGIDLATARGRRLRELRSRIGLVFQDPASSLNPRATVGASIAEPLAIHSDLGVEAQRERVSGLLRAVRLDPGYAERFPHELSGGQRQRVAVARALALRPSLVIADEPTSALDVTVQAAVLDLLRELQEQFGFACLLVSHDLAVVRSLASEVVVLRHGRVVEKGRTDEILSSPTEEYTRMLLAAAPVADPVRQARRREAWQRFADEERRGESAA
ncbi:peptide/nickel transport system ATP-binding protein [Frondihabitans australicus]|uniref:Peptide/nickel transport system ATP-binding protein n=1 Tax=Frondihabitans australicus TaxID=386892 RepID=A0A495IMU9_9MICO|nr:peptide/nickel transport system ATP-binding protein [Frondihabitans australicus]